jgi:hypothetical protein
VREGTALVFCQRIPHEGSPVGTAALERTAAHNAFPNKERSFSFPFPFRFVS